MIQKNKKQIILSAIVTLLPIVVGLAMWNSLPERMTTHWGMSGEADGFSSKAFAVFALPIIMLVVQCVCILATAKDPKNKDQNNKVFGMILWIIPITSLITSGIVYAVSLGSNISIDVCMRMLLGLMFIMLGNYLPKCKQNHTIGVKVTWTLQNEENWNKTHRFTGRLWGVGGVILLATMFVPLENIMWAFLVFILILSFVPMIYSYLYYRKQVKAGTATRKKLESDPKREAWEKKVTIVSLIISIPILILAGIILFTGDINIEYKDVAFTIDSAYWESMTVDYAEVSAIEYREQDTSGSRVGGFGSLKLEMGNFENEEFGRYNRYSYIGCESCVVLYSKNGRVLVVNGEDEESTKEIYEELKSRVVQ